MSLLRSSLNVSPSKWQNGDLEPKVLTTGMIRASENMKAMLSTNDPMQVSPIAKASHGLYDLEIRALQAENQQLREMVVSLQRRLDDMGTREFVSKDELRTILANARKDFETTLIDRGNRMQAEIDEMKNDVKQVLSTGVNNEVLPSSSQFSPVQAKSTCIVRAPKGFVKGESAHQRAQNFNEHVIARLKTLPGHVTKPEVIGMHPLKVQNGDDGQLFLAYFSHACEVRKLLAYKGQLAKDPELRSVFIRPDFAKEEREARRSLVDAARLACADLGKDWRMKWCECMELVLVSPCGKWGDLLAWDGERVQRIENERIDEWRRERKMSLKKA